MYERFRELTWKSGTSCRSIAVKDDTRELVTEPDAVRRRWKEYIEFDNRGKPDFSMIEEEAEVLEDCIGPDILESEVLAAIKKLKENKAVGVDCIPAEFWKTLGDRDTKELVGLCKEMHALGVWPEDHTRVILIPLPKKCNAVDCGDHRTISLIAHASKIMLKVLTKRVEAKTGEFIGRNQFGFRKGYGTRDAIGVLRTLCERSLEMEKMCTYAL